MYNYQKYDQTIISNLWITLKSRGISSPVTVDMGNTIIDKPSYPAYNGYMTNEEIQTKSQLLIALSLGVNHNPAPKQWEILDAIQIVTSELLESIDTSSL